MKLYHHPNSNNCRKVTAVAHHIGADLEYQLVDLFKGEHKKPDYLALNPNGKVPVLVDGDFTLWESSAIMIYIADKHPSSLWPDDRRRYDILRWMSWQLSHWGPATSIIVYERLFKPFLKIGEPDEARLKQGEQQFATVGTILNNHLENKKYIVGEGLTLADFAIAADLSYAAPARIPVEQFAHIERWYDAISALPAWKETAPRI